MIAVAETYREHGLSSSGDRIRSAQLELGPERTAWLVLVPWRWLRLGDSATAIAADLAASARD